MSYDSTALRYVSYKDGVDFSIDDSPILDTNSITLSGIRTAESQVDVSTITEFTLRPSPKGHPR